MANNKISALDEAVQLTGREMVPAVQDGETVQTSSGSLGGGYCVNPLDYGAIGDGVEDDSDAIQAAIDTGRPVRLPPGTFKIKSTINLSQYDFIGSGCKSTIIDADGCDAFNVPLSSTRLSVDISHFSVYSLAENCQDQIAFKFVQDTGNTGARSSGFKFTFLEIGKQALEQFGAAFQISDAFRVTLDKIGINNCHSDVLLIGQVVQFQMTSVFSNYDQQFSSTVNDGVSYGLFLDGSSHTGTYQIPESIQVSECGLTFHAVGCYNHDSLHVRIKQNDFDFCTLYGLRVFATNGFTFEDNYVALKNSAALYGMKFEVAIFECKNVNIEKNYIVSYPDATNANKIAIFFDDAFWFGARIVGNEVRALDAASKWKYGIFMNQSKRFSVCGNVVLNDAVTDEGIYLNGVEDFQLTENICEDSDILYTIGAGSFWVHNNICAAISQTAVGTSKGYSFQPQNIILKNANISTGIVQYDPTGVLKTGMIDTAVDFDDLITPGEYANTHATNSPNAGYGFYYVSVRRSAAAVTQFALPPVVDTSPTTVKAYIRSSADSGANWTAWRQFAMV